MEVKNEVKSADGTIVQVRFGCWRCLICGEVFLGIECPSHCPFCGVHSEHISRPEAFSPEMNDVGTITDQERANLQESAQTESTNSQYYEAMAKMSGPDDLRAVYKRLSRIEAEHCGIFCKLLGQKKPKDSETAPPARGAWVEDIRSSLAREVSAHETYARFASESRNKRLKTVWNALSEVELDHVALETSQLSSFPGTPSK